MVPGEMRMFWVFMMLLRPDFLPLKFYVLDVFGDLHNFSIHAGGWGKLFRVLTSYITVSCAASTEKNVSLTFGSSSKK